MNRIAPRSIETAPCPVVDDPQALAETCHELLGDESRLRAKAVEAAYFPETIAHAADALGRLNVAGKRCVVSGARTGIAGAAVPVDAEAVLSIQKMNSLLALGRDGDTWYARCEPGMSLADLRDILHRRNVTDLPDASDAERAAASEYAAGDFQLWLPVDPTEMTASLGGVVSTNASGARTYRYGPMRDWVRSLTVLLADGRELTVRRGEIAAQAGTFVLEQPDGSESVIHLPAIQLPQTKATLGYHLDPTMDLVDLLVGSEGTLGLVAGVEVRLAVRPPSVLGVLAVVENEAKALDLVEAARNRDDIAFDAIEYFDPGSLKLLAQKKEADGPGSEIPDIPSWDGAAVYFEVSGTEEETEAAVEPLEDLLALVGSSVDETWAAMEADELDHQKKFRHAVPEAVNALIGQRATKIPGLHKVGTDMAVPDSALKTVFELYRGGLQDIGLENSAVIFGHIGDNHVHVNLLPNDLDELKKAKELYLRWAREVVALGGAVAAEHGIGRIKKSMLEIQFAPDVLEAMRAIRRSFDPKGTLAPGVLV